jgi:hypothetical protein
MRNDQIRTQIGEALGAHGVWKMKLKTAIATGRAPADPAEIARDDRCQFGQWIRTLKADPAQRANPDLAQVDRLHAEFHRCAGRVADLAARGDPAGAAAALDSAFASASTALGAALTAWKGKLA